MASDPLPSSDVAGVLDAAPLPRYLQLMWGRERPGRRGPRPGRTIWEIGAAGAAVADRDGLDGVSMKSVAAELGLTPMSLYRYVDSKDELLLVLMDVAYGRVDPSVVASGPWRSRLASWGRALAGALVAHPWVLDVPISAPPVTPNILGWTELGVRAFGDARLTGQQKLSALLVLDGYVRSHVRQSVSMGLVDQPALPAGTPGYVESLGMLLNPQQHASLIAASSALSDDDGDFFQDELSFGLELVLDGIAALARSRR